MSEETSTPRLKRLRAAVRRDFLDHEMVPANGRVLVAVSGGPDSTALLVLLSRLRKSLRLELHAAHFDHGLRGSAAAAGAAAFVRELAAELGVPLSLGRGDVRAVARVQKLSLEQAARQERYAFLARTAAETGCTAVATGHTASDQAETVLMHLVRGSGVAGLSGMAPVSRWPFAGHRGLKLLRPLLRLSREDTVACCADAGLAPIEDESNASPRFRRNRVRNEVLPLLRELNPRIDDALARLATAAASDDAYIKARARAALRGRDGLGVQRLGRRRFKEAPSSLRRHALRIALGRVAGDLQDFGEKHLVAIERLVIEGKTGDSLDLQRGVTAELRRHDVTLCPATSGAPEGLPDEAVAIAMPGAARLGPLTVSIAMTAPDSGAWVEVDADAVGRGVSVQKRRDGDRFQPLGMQGEKKLQDFFVDAHVPRGQRDRVPIFESERGIVWVGGYRIADWAQPQPGKPTVFLAFEDSVAE